MRILLLLLLVLSLAFLAACGVGDSEQLSIDLMGDEEVLVREIQLYISKGMSRENVESILGVGMISLENMGPEYSTYLYSLKQSPGEMNHLSLVYLRDAIHSVRIYQNMEIVKVVVQ